MLCCEQAEYAFFLLLSAVLTAPKVAYNLIYSLAQHIYDTDCNLFLRVSCCGSSLRMQPTLSVCCRPIEGPPFVRGEYNLPSNRSQQISGLIADRMCMPSNPPMYHRC